MRLKFTLKNIFVFTLILILIKVSVSIYLLHQLKTPLTFSWMILFIAVIILGASLILLGWWLVFIYYRKILPHDLFAAITQKNTQTPDKNTAKLTAKIKAYYQERNLMLSALSHDIRTPLTEAMLKLELLDDPNIAASIRTNLENINQIIKSSLDFSKSPEDIQKVPVNLVSLVEQIAEGYDDKHFKIVLAHDGDAIEATVNTAFFKRAIENLLNNAKKYASSASIQISETDKAVMLKIIDNGHGVPESDLKQLATPYFRVDQSRSKDTGGTGLGLAIVKKIMQLHKGSVEFKNDISGGFAVTLTLPNNKTDKLSLPG